MSDLTERDTNVRSRRAVALTTVAFVCLGVVAGLVWLWLAEPAQWQIRDNGVVLTEGAAKAQFSVLVTFVLVGAAASVVAGFAAGWFLDDLGWLVTPLVAGLAIAAALIAWRVGVELGPPDPASVTGGSIGDTISARLEIDSVAPFLTWPMAALLGVVTAACIDRRSDRHGDPDGESSPIYR